MSAAAPEAAITSERINAMRLMDRSCATEPGLRLELHSTLIVQRRRIRIHLRPKVPQDHQRLSRTRVLVRHSSLGGGFSDEHFILRQLKEANHLRAAEAKLIDL